MMSHLITSLLLVKTWLNPRPHDERGVISTEVAVIAAAAVALAITVGAAIAAYAIGQLSALQ